MAATSRKALVTGSEGFIGSHLTELLVREGYSVRCLVLYNSFGSWGWLEELPEDTRRRIEIVMGDVRDPHGLRELMKGCDVVFHLAALVAIPYSYRSPDLYVDTNVRGALNVLQAARDLGGVKVIHTSTSEVYGTARAVPITEDHPLSAQSPYAATKIAADQLALSFHLSFGLPVTVVRPFNTYGPRQSARAVIPTVVTQVLSGARKLKLGSIEPTRDFSFVEDIARGFVAADRSERALGQVVNLGSGLEVSIGRIVELVAEIAGAMVEIEQGIERVRPERSEVARLLADTSKAKLLLGWEPRHRGLEGLRDGLATTIEWFSRPGIRGRYKPEIYNV